MTFTAPDPVSSGRHYPILVIGAGAPTELQQFDGDTRFTIDKDGAESTICGCGARDDAGVRFHEKDLGSGKDVRTWQIHETADGHFLAEPAAPF